MSKSLNLNKLLDNETINLGSIKNDEEWLKVMESLNLMMEDKTIKFLRFEISSYNALRLSKVNFIPTDFLKYFALSEKRTLKL